MSEARDTLIIAAALPADVPAIQALLQQAGLPHEDFAAHRANFLVARQEGALVGTVGFEQYGHDALLRSLVVAPGWQGDGLGGALLKRIEDMAQRQGVRDFYLLTTTAEHFFAKRWFRKIARHEVPPAIAATREFSSLCPASSICMNRTVKP